MSTNDSDICTDISATDKDGERVYMYSKYAPLNPEGALPHSISAGLVSALYKGHVKRALKDVGLSSGSIPRKILLRQALDEPANRKKLWFADRIYSYSRGAPWGKHIYSRLVKPAEYKDGPKTLLDADKFIDLIDVLVREQESPVPRVTHSSEWEALALMTMGYSMIQIDDCTKLCEALGRLGPGFRDYLGIDTDHQSEVHEEIDDAGISTTKTTGNISLGGESNRRTEQSSPRHIGRRGVSAESLREMHDQLRQMRRIRQTSGSSDELDRAAFNDYADAEQAQLIKIRSYEDELDSEYKRIVESAREASEKYFPGVALEQSRPSNALALAEWIDNHVYVSDALSQSCKLLDGALEELHASDAEKLSQRYSAPDVFSIESVLEEIEKYRKEVDAVIFELRASSKSYSDLVLKIADVESPIPSSSLFDLSADEVVGFLEHIQYDNNLKELAPFLLRHLGELGYWSSVDTAQGYQVLNRIVDERATSGDINNLVEVFGCLTPSMLQELLTYGDQKIARTTILASIYMSLAEGGQTYFNEIWPCHSWEPQSREEALGRVAYKFLNHLQTVFNKADGRIEVLKEMLSQAFRSGQAAKDDSARIFSSSDDLAKRLTYQSPIDNRFYQLRKQASALYFEDLALAICEERIKDALTEVSRVRRDLESGELQEAVISEAGNRRQFDANHLSHLRRYVDNRIKKVQEWCTDFNAVDAQRKKADNVDKKLKRLIHQLSGHEVADVAEKCSVNWFKYELYKILDRFASASDLEGCWSNFGELASLESLFVSDASSREVVGQSVEWPVWLPPEPKSMSLWGDFVGDHPNWRSLYQDAVATLVLGRDPSPSEVVENLLNANLIDSASAACDFSGFKQDSEVGKRRPTIEQAVKNQQTLTDLLNRCDELEDRFTSDHARSQFDKLENRLLATPDYIARKSPQSVGKLLSKIERDLANIVSELSASDDDSKAHRAQLESWLAEAGVGLAAGESIESMERRINQEKKKRSSRRIHLEVIEQLTDQEVPRSLRKKLSEFLEINDRPSRWPTEAQAEETYLYVEQLAEQRQRWWDSLSAIVSLGETRVKLQLLDDCIEQNLLLGLEELLVEKHDRGAEFLTLFDRAPALSLEGFYDLMNKEGFCQKLPSKTPDTKLNRPGPTNIGSQIKLTAQMISSAMEDIPNQKNAKGVEIKGAVVAIGKNDYDDAERIALGVLGDTSSKDHSDVSTNLATAIHAWIYSTKGQVLDRELATKAFGIFFGYWDVLQKAEFRDAANAILMDWLSLANVKGDSAPSLLVNYLSQCRESTDERRILGEVINICGAEKVAINIWKSLAGHEKLTADGRTQLLLLLHDLECEDAIFSLISRFSPSTQSLLRNYLVLITRASMEQNSDLFLAIHQTLKRLSSKKDTGLRPVKDFARTLSRRFQYKQPPIDLTLVDVDRINSSNTYSLVVRLQPDLGDPPIGLTVSVSDEDGLADFRIAKNASREWIVCESDILLEAREHEFLVEAIDERAAHSIVFDFSGSTVTGNEVNGSVSLEVGGASTSAFLPLSLDELLEIYEGYDGKPVKGRAFVGRLDELEAIRKSVALERAGAIIVYGVRRIGKTSLLQASAEQTCVSFDASRNSIVLTVPVDSFSPKSDSGSFLDRFLLHIMRSITGTKNASLMSYLKKQGASKTSIQKAAQFDDNDRSLPFADRLDIYLSRLCNMAGKSVDRAIIAFDEFDKLLEAYVGDLVGSVEQLTNQLRLVATEYDHVGLIIAGSELMRKITDQYRNALYGSTAVIELSCFDAPEQYEDAFRIIEPAMLGGRRDFSLVGKMIVQITGGHPLYMRTLACAAASLTKRNRISPGLVNDAVRKLLKNEVLHGYIPDPGNTVRQPLQALSLMTNRLDEERARLILHVIATRTTLESPFVDWSRIMKSPVLERLGTPTEWRRYRDELRDANLLRHKPKYQWGIRFPILAETMRLDEEVEIERLTAVIEELQEELIK